MILCTTKMNLIFNKKVLILKTKTCTQNRPYNTKFAENTSTLYFLIISSIWKAGAHILITSALASGLREIAQPSLLESTITGLSRKSGRKMRSQDLSKAFDNSCYQKLDIIKGNFIKLLVIKYLKAIFWIFTYDNIKYFLSLH